MTFHAILTGPKQPNIGAIDALLTACGHTPLRHIKQHYDAEQGCWCVEGEVESMNAIKLPTVEVLDGDKKYYTSYDLRNGTTDIGVLDVQAHTGELITLELDVLLPIAESLVAIHKALTQPVEEWAN